MKKIILCLVVLIPASSMYAQDIDYAPVRVEYTRLPLTPLPKTVKNYQVLILADYLPKIQKQKADFQAQSAKGDSDFLAAMKQYEETNKQLSAAHEIALNVWFRLTPQQQAVTPKPVLTVLPVPVKPIMEEPVYERTFNTELLATTNIKLEGFQRLPENAVIFQVNLSGYESDEPKIGTQKKSQKGADGKSIEVDVFVYKFNYRHLFKVKIIQPDGKYLMDEVYGPTTDYVAYTSKDFPTQAELETWWKLNKGMEAGRIQETIVNNQLKLFNNYINNQYGYVNASRNVTLAFVDEKTLYDDIKEGMNHAKNGYAVIGKQITYAQGEDYLKKAIDKWETALKESNPKNKKARIDEDVTEMLLMNIAEAYVWLNEFTRAQENITRAQAFKMSSKERALVAGIKSFLTDQNARFTANQGL
ncbi:MAG: hypothetical protein M3R27_06090 [Bacteroidota bacterium]|nr:hypothetical protein [Bacteroidota bacterium]